VKTLYLRNVPDDVAERLERLAARESMSVNALAVRELARISRRVDNAALVDALPDLPITPAQILEVIDEGRAAR
jgi:plasmid stability protein